MGWAACQRDSRDTSLGKSGLGTLCLAVQLQTSPSFKADLLGFWLAFPRPDGVHRQLNVYYFFLHKEHME